MAGLRPFRRFAALVPTCLVALGAAPALAQTGTDKAAAEALFDQGVRLMKSGSLTEACPKLEESERIDPAVGTLLYLGECYEKTGKTASAWATFREAASLATTSSQPDRARLAAGRAQELEPKLSRLSVEVAPEAANIPGLVVKRGPNKLEPSLYGTPLPVDPGDYRVEASAPGYEPWSTPVKVEAGQANASVRVPVLVKAPEGAAAAPATGGGVEGPLAERPPAAVAVKSSGLTTQQTLGIVAGGVGIVGVGLGSYFGIRAISKNSDAEQHCPKEGFCSNTTGVELTNQARDSAAASNVAFAVGAGLVAVGAVLYLTGGRSESERLAVVPLFSPGAAAASISGRF
ncbi:MAG: hypothetical protein EOO73_32775 [Myxococcales bacterium]|nr:MAG: hypothetical protein EOO73_32775 [Myxococcales bacterium]